MKMSAEYALPQTHTTPSPHLQAGKALFIKNARAAVRRPRNVAAAARLRLATRLDRGGEAGGEKL